MKQIVEQGDGFKRIKTQKDKNDKIISLEERIAILEKEVEKLKNKKEVKKDG